MLALAGCTDEPDDGRLALETAAPRWQHDGLAMRAGIVFEPSTPMREALARGVNLHLAVTTRMARRFGPVALTEATRTESLEISFLPLTEQWVLDDGRERRTFARLWMLLEALQAPRDWPTGLEPRQLGHAAWQVQIRARFDRGRLPSPMRLPALLSPAWRLGTQWHTWQFEQS